MPQALLFATVGLAFGAHWVLADPSFDVSDTQSDWAHVLGFSGALLVLAVALPVFARLVRSETAFRASVVAATGAAWSSAANVVEDGLGFGWAFFAFILGAAIMLVGLAGLVVATALVDGRRLYALVPAGTLAGIVLYVYVGGPLMLVTWLAAAGLALRRPSRARRR